ncbi:ABC transporter permease [Candidatus Entotheonella palauensis]|uniref:ABC transporter permease n=1 Tax=Candidatus Entotheonella palauensis TaxID=93172 RepID=UPI000B7F0F07|nr:ABC transporter permease [Candidatus Entotheonella palauensis]
MDYIIDAFLGAFRLILTLDSEIFTIAWFSLQVAGTATVLATVMGVPLAYVIATRHFPGKPAILTLFNTLMAMPTVVVGLFCYAFLSRRGPLGFLDLLFTPSGMIIGDLILALPLIVALTIAAVNAVDPRVQLTARALGATSRQTAWTVLLDARYALMTAVLNGFGRVIAEVGAAAMLGGNIRGYTRTLTTAIALETSKGEFALAMALGLILLTLALMVNLLLRRLQEV